MLFFHRFRRLLFRRQAAQVFEGPCDRFVERRVRFGAEEGAIELGLHAHADYLARRGTPAGLEALAGHSLIGPDRQTPWVREMLKRWPQFARERLALRADSDVAQLALVRAGAGIGVCQVALARRTPGLVRVLPDDFGLPLETWVTMHEDLRDSPRCRVTFDALAEALARHAGAPDTA